MSDDEYIQSFALHLIRCTDDDVDSVLLDGLTLFGQISLQEQKKALSHEMAALLYSELLKYCHLPSSTKEYRRFEQAMETMLLTMDLADIAVNQKCFPGCSSLIVKELLNISKNAHFFERVLQTIASGPPDVAIEASALVQSAVPELNSKSLMVVLDLLRLFTKMLRRCWSPSSHWLEAVSTQLLPHLRIAYNLNAILVVCFTKDVAGDLGDEILRNLVAFHEAGNTKCFEEEISAIQILGRCEAEPTFLPIQSFFNIPFSLPQASFRLALYSGKPSTLHLENLLTRLCRQLSASVDNDICVYSVSMRMIAESIKRIDAGDTCEDFLINCLNDWDVYEMHVGAVRLLGALFVWRCQKNGASREIMQSADGPLFWESLSAAHIWSIQQDWDLCSSKQRAHRAKLATQVLVVLNWVLSFLFISMSKNLNMRSVRRSLVLWLFPAIEKQFISVDIDNEVLDPVRKAAGSVTSILSRLGSLQDTKRAQTFSIESKDMTLLSSHLILQQHELLISECAQMIGNPSSFPQLAANGIGMLTVLMRLLSCSDLDDERGVRLVSDTSRLLLSHISLYHSVNDNLFGLGLSCLEVVLRRSEEALEVIMSRLLLEAESKDIFEGFPENEKGSFADQFSRFRDRLHSEIVEEGDPNREETKLSFIFVKKLPADWSCFGQAMCALEMQRTCLHLSSALCRIVTVAAALPTHRAPHPLSTVLSCLERMINIFQIPTGRQLPQSCLNLVHNFYSAVFPLLSNMSNGLTGADIQRESALPNRSVSRTPLWMRAIRLEAFSPALVHFLSTLFMAAPSFLLARFTSEIVPCLEVFSKLTTTSEQISRSKALQVQINQLLSEIQTHSTR